jgi:Ethanolamine utilization protein EutJ (predicted chaperonin)
MIPFLLALPLATKITVAITLAVALFGAGLYQGVGIGEASCREAVIESQTHTIQAVSEQVLVTDKIVTDYTKAIGQVQKRSREILRNAKIDDSIILPSSFRVFHDSSATNSVPSSTDVIDAATVSIADVTETINTNYGTCQENITQLNSLQEWVRNQSKIE